MTRPEIEPWSPSSLANTLLIRPMANQSLANIYSLFILYSKKFKFSFIQKKKRTHIKTNKNLWDFCLLLGLFCFCFLNKKPQEMIQTKKYQCVS